MTRSPAERQYDVWARFYDTIWRRYSERTSRALLERADIRPDHRILDVGCGTGTIERLLLDGHPEQHITGVDISEKMLRRARTNAHGPNVRFVRASASSLPFADGAFDVVLSASALHYFPEPHAALAEMRRVLVPGGRTYVLDWCRDSFVMRLRDAILRTVDPAHVRCYTQAEARSMIAEARFDSCQSETFRSGTYRLLLCRAVWWG